MKIALIGYGKMGKTIEQGLDQIFVLADEEKEVYRCKYCEEKYSGKRNK